MRARRRGPGGREGYGNQRTSRDAELRATIVGRHAARQGLCLPGLAFYSGWLAGLAGSVFATVLRGAEDVLVAPDLAVPVDADLLRLGLAGAAGFFAASAGSPAGAATFAAGLAAAGAVG